jgi:predicted nucleic acid-binding protein
VPSSVDLLDANVWLALALEAHTHHRQAKAYWEKDAAPTTAFCRVTQTAFLRLLTSKTVMGNHVLSQSSAWSTSADFLALPEVELLAEPIGLEGAWARWSEAGELR